VSEHLVAFAQGPRLDERETHERRRSVCSVSMRVQQVSSHSAWEVEMRKVVVSEYVTLDGVMEAPGDPREYEHGGWSNPYFDDAIARYKYDELFASDALLVGRVTYEGFAAAWPGMEAAPGDEQAFADRMNSLPKYVVSTTLDKAEWNNSTLLKGDAAEAVAALKQQEGQDILVGGSAQLVRALLRSDLIDEIRLLVHPVVVGSGKRLFTDESATSLTLAESKAFATGVVLLRYAVRR
jgi:dihydrofolate reductase